MKRKETYPFIVTFIWFAFIVAISFMEAPIKFTAPLLTLPVGLDVGRHVFAALNIAEIIFAVTALISVVLNRSPFKINLLLSLILIILFIQTIWLLPVLNERALEIIGGKNPASSIEHILYIILESIKMISLFVLGLMQVANFKKNLKSNFIAELSQNPI